MNSKCLDAAGRESADKTFLHATLRFLRQPRTLILVFGTIIVAAIALSWQSSVPAGLLPLLWLAPCMIMMFMCMRHATGGHCQKDAQVVSTEPQPASRETETGAR